MTPKDKAQWPPDAWIWFKEIDGKPGKIRTIETHPTNYPETPPGYATATHISLEKHHSILEAREKAAAERARAEAYEEFSDWIYYDRDEECRGDEDCDHCHFKSMAVQIRAALEQSPSAQAEGEKE